MRTAVILVMCVLLLSSFATAFIGSTAIRRSMRLNEVGQQHLKSHESGVFCIVVHAITDTDHHGNRLICLFIE